MPYPEEAVLVSNAVDARRGEFTTVRHCARRAMREPGLPGTPYCPEGTVLPDGRPGPWEASRTVPGTGAPHRCAVRTSEADEMTSTPRLRAPHAALPPGHWALQGRWPVSEGVILTAVAAPASS